MIDWLIVNWLIDWWFTLYRQYLSYKTAGMACTQSPMFWYCKVNPHWSWVPSRDQRILQRFTRIWWSGSTSYLILAIFYITIVFYQSHWTENLLGQGTFPWILKRKKGKVINTLSTHAHSFHYCFNLLSVKFHDFFL